MRKHVAGSIGLGFAFLTLCPSAARADAVITWSENAVKAAKAACVIASGNGLAESRMYAMMHAAVHDAVNAIDRRSRPYAFDWEITGPVSVEAAAAAAARDALVSVIAGLPESAQCVADGIADVDASYAAALAAIPDDPAKTNGVALGQAAAAAIVALRADDGSDAPWVDFNYPQGTEPGEWRFTPDGPPLAFAPYWGQVTPFVLKRSAQFRPQPPYHLASSKYAADYNEIKLLGGDGITTPSARTADQTQIGLFWIESSPLAWNRLARAVSVSMAFDLWENARLFALLNLAMADGYIVGGQVSLQVLAADHRDSAGRHRRQSRHGRRAGLDAIAANLSHAGSRLRPRSAGRRRGGDPETGLRHRRHLVHGLQHDGRRGADV
jgi:hypothetical protein